MNPLTPSGPWSANATEEFLVSTVIPMRLAIITLSGEPVVASHWFLYDKGLLWCATKEGSLVDRCLASTPKCGFEISPDAPPYHGVRGRGIATRTPDHGLALLRRLHDRYLGEDETRFRNWLLGRDDGEIAVSIQPTRLMSWDYSKRMGEC